MTVNVPPGTRVRLPRGLWLTDPRGAGAFGTVVDATPDTFWWPELISTRPGWTRASAAAPGSGLVAVRWEITPAPKGSQRGTSSRPGSPSPTGRPPTTTTARTAHWATARSPPTLPSAPTEHSHHRWTYRRGKAKRTSRAYSAGDPVASEAAGRRPNDHGRGARHPSRPRAWCPVIAPARTGAVTWVELTDAGHDTVRRGHESKRTLPNVRCSRRSVRSRSRTSAPRSITSWPTTPRSVADYRRARGPGSLQAKPVPVDDVLID